MIKRKIVFALSPPLLIVAIPHLYWLAGMLFGAVILWLLFSSKLPIVIWFRDKKWLSSVVLLFAVVIVAVVIRIFFIEIFSIPSGSMEDTLLTGDKILVSKLNYGPALPRSPYEIPWLNLIWYLKAGKNAKFDSTYWDYTRLKGYSTIRNNDVLVFSHPLWGNRDNFFIKRCVGIPGDTLQITKGVVTINKRALIVPELAKQRYLVKSNNLREFWKKTDSLHIGGLDYFPNLKEKTSEFVLTQAQRKQLNALACVDSITLMPVCCDSSQWINDKNLAWTIDDFGPLVIPREGTTIELTQPNYLIYQQTIRELEKQKIEQKGDSFYLNGAESISYTFKHNYYFMMGDNRYNSQDSRYWGLVPEESIVGKACLVLISSDWSGFRWNRMLKAIR